MQVLTHRELQVADLVEQGLQSGERMEKLSLSKSVQKFTTICRNLKT